MLIYSPEHENELLREPWRSRGRPTAISRPCVFGRRCVCMHAAIDGRSQSGGIVLSESMSPSELVAFEERGEYPPMRRPCILCTRANVMDTYIRTRKSCSSGARTLGFIVNWYANPAGAGGYSTDSCIPFPEDGETWMGVFGKVASFLPGKLRMVQDTITRRWSIDQSLMLHDTPSQRSSGPQVIHCPLESPKEMLNRRTVVISRRSLKRCGCFFETDRTSGMATSCAWFLQGLRLRWLKRGLSSCRRRTVFQPV